MASEDVLLIIKNVKVKKSDGRLYLMGSRMAWMQASSDTFSKSFYYADIRVQKISPDTKDKVQLQIVMHDGSAMTFQFANPGGRIAAQEDREGAKELLQQLLPKFRKKVNSELEEKNKMLQDDPELFQLYKDLVVSGIVSPDEFWNNRKNTKNTNAKSTKQEIGVSGGFLSDIKSTDGCNGLKYNLTADTIEAIFRTYPAVQKKHAENVPHNLSESEFWTRFFQSHYFHRDRTNFTQKEIFAECAKHDEQVMREEREKKKDDSLVDLAEMTDGVMGDGYGLEKEFDKSAMSAGAAANSSLIRRFNHHSTMVLKAADKHGTLQNDTQLNGTLPVATASASKPSATNTVPNGHGAQQQLPGEPPPKRAKIKEKLEYEDLGSGDTQKATPSGPSLRLTKMDRYLHGPTPVSATHYKTSDDVLQAHQRVMQDILAWTPDHTQVLSGTVAVTALGELSPGGALMQGYTQQQLHQLVPQEVQQELKNLYNALCELLRHFWSCFPANTPFLEEKVVNMRANLEKFQFSKINPLKEKLAHSHYNLNLCGHMEEMIGAAFNKFNTWQARKSGRR